jgi:hypothetical protein
MTNGKGHDKDYGAKIGGACAGQEAEFRYHRLSWFEARAQSY